MALDFPNAPTDGLVYTAPTGEQWVYEAATNSWTSKGLVNNSGGLKYVGTIDITAAPPTGATGGAMYTVQADGTANAGFGPGITGALMKGDSILYTGSGWIKLSHPTAAWVVNGTVISPATVGDTAQISAGTAALPGLAVVGDPNTGIYSPGTDQLAISTAGVERVLVTSEGRVGIGTASVSGAVRCTLSGNDTTVSPGFALKSSAFDLTVSSSSPTSSDADFWLASSGFIRFGTANLERTRITNDGFLRLAAGTGGIQFGGDTAAANALNDYEEGTWTPSLGGTATYGKNSGAYIKVGRLVTVTLHTVVTSIGTGSLTTLSGLPFPPAEDGFGSAYWTNAAGAYGYMTAYAFFGGSAIQFYNATAPVVSLTSGPTFQNGTDVRATVTYIA